MILQVEVPTQDVVETKNGKKVIKEKKLFPGYVIVQMYMTDDSWYVVRNTRGVTGFVGPASKPVPLSPEELRKMGIRRQQVEIDLAVGDQVKIIDGPFEGMAGEVEVINLEKSKIKVNLSVFGRETLTELDFDQAEKLKSL